MVKLTGLLSTYYDLPLLQGRLDNLLTQDVDMEYVVICETGSQEEDIILEWCQDDNISSKVILLPTIGIPTLYDAWNMGIEIANGEYLTNINTDDRLYPGALQKMIDVLDNDPDIGVVYPDVHRVAEIDGEPFGTYTWAEGDFDVLIHGCFLGPMPMWRKSLHDKYGLFDPGMHSSGDYDFWLRLAKAGVKMQRIAEPLGAYFDREESIEHREPIRTVWETANARSRYR
jgi:glycosyltransferase involved in cell wall biosynthesis